MLDGCKVKGIRYHPAIGLSISNKNNDLKKISKAPLIGKNVLNLMEWPHHL